VNDNIHTNDLESDFSSFFSGKIEELQNKKIGIFGACPLGEKIVCILKKSDITDIAFFDDYISDLEDLNGVSISPLKNIFQFEPEIVVVASTKARARMTGRLNHLYVYCRSLSPGKCTMFTDKIIRGI